MSSNEEFLNVIMMSFKTYLEVGTSRSTAKLKSLHGSIARDIKEKLGVGYEIRSQGVEGGSEKTAVGRYYPKRIDIAVLHKGKVVAGYGVKFVMRNYSQNSNNYFENMLGETANLRCGKILYFQIFIIFDKIPYFKKDGSFSRYDEVSEHNMAKYVKLSDDDVKVYFHTPDKMLFILLYLREKNDGNRFVSEKDYASFYLDEIKNGKGKGLLNYSTPSFCEKFGNAVIFNDYADFVERSVQLIKGNQKN